MPEWFHKLQEVVLSQQETTEKSLETDSQNTREEWMILADLHTPFEHACEQNLKPVSDWHQDRTNCTVQQIGEMPTWIKTKKEEVAETIQQNV